MRLAVTIVHLVIAAALMVIVLFQQGKDAGMGGIAGGSSDTFYGKNKPRTAERMLERITAILAVLFVLSSLSLAIFFA